MHDDADDQSRYTLRRMHTFSHRYARIEFRNQNSEFTIQKFGEMTPRVEEASLDTATRMRVRKGQSSRMVKSEG